MKTIPVTEETWERLQAHAEPLVDDADSVIRRLLAAWDEMARLGTQSSEELSTGVPTSEAIRHDHREHAAMPVTTKQSGGRSRSIPTILVLRQAGKVRAGTRIAVLVDKLPGGADADARQFTARFAPNVRDVIWDLDGQTYSISRLAMKLRVEFGVHANQDSENGNRVFGLASDRSISLEDVRKRLEGRA